MSCEIIYVNHFFFLRWYLSVEDLAVVLIKGATFYYQSQTSVFKILNLTQV